MVKNSITVFARVKPEKIRKGVVNYKIHRRPKKHSNEDFLVLTAPQKFAEYIDNRPESWNFSFNRIFEHSVGQEDVFKSVARPVVNSVFDGYNATIFAYGQTGSGKTFTITGEPGIHSERGILPRTLQYIFDIIEKNPENLYSVEIAYLEIYNENGYDLLLERRQREAATRLEDLPRVTIQEDENGTMHLKNLSFRIVENEKEALKFLVDGDMYRAISETPMNPRSSRSHCIFTIVISVKKSGAERYTRAKMHLVDLAGSERVYKCSIQGAILTEAKHINLSLHFLEQVIVCLGQDNVSHVPYRNSLLTSILRDSLGGNCLTTMLATLSVSNFNLEETISTCRFAQRVALVKNDVNLTFELDTKSENLLLRMENERLKKQIEEMKKSASQLTLRDSTGGIGGLDYYKNLVVQRDQEISHLIDLLKKERSRRKSGIEEVTQRVSSLPSQEQKATQVPSSRVSPRKIDETPPTNLKKRTHVNSLAGKARITPRRNQSISPKSARKILPKKFVSPPEIPGLILNDDEDISAEGNSQELPKIGGNIACQIGSKTERKEPQSELNLPPEPSQIDAGESERSVRRTERETQTPRPEILIATSDDYKTDSYPSFRKGSDLERKSGRDRSPSLGFPQNVMKMIRNSRNRQSDDKESTSSPRSETPKSLRGTNILRSMLCKEKKSARESSHSPDDNKQLNDSSPEEDSKLIIDNFKKSLPLTGDPEIDEEIIAFYKAKRSGGTY